MITSILNSNQCWVVDNSLYPLDYKIVYLKPKYVKFNSNEVLTSQYDMNT